MKGLLAVLFVVALGACARTVKVNSAPSPSEAAVSLHVTNSLSQPVNVYVTNGGTDTLLGQVAANTSQVLSVSGVPAGATVTLKAVTADGSRTYTKDNVTLGGDLRWSVP